MPNISKYKIFLTAIALLSFSFEINGEGKGNKLLTGQYWLKIFNRNMVFKLALITCELFKLK